MGSSRHEKRKEARLQKNKKKHESWLQSQKSQKEKRASSSFQKDIDVIKSEDVHQIRDNENEYLESRSPRGNKDDGKSFLHDKSEVRIKSKEKKMHKVHRMKDLQRPKKKTKFEEFLGMDTATVISGDQDVELERRLAKKLKVKKGKLRGLDDGMNDLFEGLPSVLDSMGSELGDSHKKRKKKRSEEIQDHEVVAEEANEDVELEESEFLIEASEEDPQRKRDRKQRKKERLMDEELESDQMKITDNGLLNKMAESNVETITAELATIYRTVARSVSSQIFCEEVLTTYARGNEQ